MVGLAATVSRSLVDTTTVTERAAESVVLPLERKPPVAFMAWRLGHGVLRPEMIHSIVGADVDRLTVPALVMRGAFQRVIARSISRSRRVMACSTA